MDARLERIGRYAAVARGLEREGAYNGAKLLQGRPAARARALRGAGGSVGRDGSGRCARGAGDGPRGRACAGRGAAPPSPAGRRPGRPHDLAARGAAGPRVPRLRRDLPGRRRPGDLPELRGARALVPRGAPGLVPGPGRPGCDPRGARRRPASPGTRAGGPHRRGARATTRARGVVGSPGPRAPAVLRGAARDGASAACWTRRSRTSRPPRSGPTLPPPTRARRTRASRPPSSPPGSRSCVTRRSSVWRACRSRPGGAAGPIPSGDG